MNNTKTPMDAEPEALARSPRDGRSCFQKYLAHGV